MDSKKKGSPKKIENWEKDTLKRKLKLQQAKISLLEDTICSLERQLEEWETWSDKDHLHEITEILFKIHVLHKEEYEKYIDWYVSADDDCKTRYTFVRELVTADFNNKCNN